MINVYLTFCSVVYHYYTRKGNEEIPVFTTFLVISVLLTLNIFTIYEITGLFIGHNLPLTKTIGYEILAVVALINAAIIYSNPSTFKEITPTRKNNNASIIYILITFVLIIVSSLIYQNNG